MTWFCLLLHNGEQYRSRQGAYRIVLPGDVIASTNHRACAGHCPDYPRQAMVAESRSSIREECLMRFVMRLVAAACLLLTFAPATAQTQGKSDDYTVQVAPGIYSLTWGNGWGNMGLNVGLSVGDDGLLLIDAQD